ncbi:MAG: hypothetical protein M1438_10390 [Deltaproteobacteria bacterium]|nr:hypothetical protein [Deltaproteobacteria bacterium]
MKFPGAIIAGLGIGLAGCLSIVPLFAGTAPAPDLAQRLGCFACHAAGPVHLAAPLDHVGSRLSRAQLQTVLSQPRQLHPGAKMPSYAYLPADERQTLADYLASLK